MTEPLGGSSPIFYITNNPPLSLILKASYALGAVFLRTSNRPGVIYPNILNIDIQKNLRILLIFGASVLFFPISSNRLLEYSIAASDPVSGTETYEIELPRALHQEDFRTVRKFAGMYNVDYRLILSIMEHESRFNRHAISPRGARGILQIMPATGRELSMELSLPDISHPVRHLRAGIYYYSKLFDLFRSAPAEERTRLALAAYNAGPSRIYDAQELAAWLGENPDDWSAVRHVLPLLSRRYASLHTHVWDEDRPPHGYFSGSKETVRYVDRVMNTYSRYVPPVR